MSNPLRRTGKKPRDFVIIKKKAHTYTVYIYIYIYIYIYRERQTDTQTEVIPYVCVICVYNIICVYV